MKAETLETTHTSARDLEAENALLLAQLHETQEALERLLVDGAGSNPESIARAPSVDSEKIGVDLTTALTPVLAEQLRLEAELENQRHLYRIELNNGLAVRLGRMLIRAADSPVRLVGLPGRLLKTWRQASRRRPSRALGRDFGKVLDAWDRGGFEAAERLLERSAAGPAMRASAWTALGRHQRKTDVAAAAESARRAHALDPQPFRLKWLVFREHEAGDVIRAAALLSALPTSTTFSESESRQADGIRLEARAALEATVPSCEAFAAIREAAADHVRRLAALEAEVAERKAAEARLVTEHSKARDALQARIDEEERKARRARRETREVRAELAAARETLERLAEENEALAEDRTTLGNDLKLSRGAVSELKDGLQNMTERFIAQRKEHQAALEEIRAELKQSRLEAEHLLAQLHETQERLAESVLEQTRAAADHERHALAERGRILRLRLEVEGLSKEQAKLHQALDERLDAEATLRLDLDAARARVAAKEQATRQLAEERRELRVHLDRLTAERRAGDRRIGRLEEALRAAADQSARQAADLGRLQAAEEVAKKAGAELTAELDKAREQLAIQAKERGALERARSELADAEERGRQLVSALEEKQQVAQRRAKSIKGRDAEIELLKARIGELEAENRDLASRRQVQLSQSSGQARELERLRQQLESYEGEDAAFRQRQHHVREEMARAEAQLELVKEILIREPSP